MKRLFSSIGIAFGALRVNKVRSALTMLGIVIGVAAVIATVAVGTGATQRVQQQIASIGSNVIIIIPGSMTNSGLRMGTGNAITLTEADARELTAQCPEITAAAPTVRGGAQIVYGDSNWATVVLGTTPSYLAIRDLAVAQGSSFTNHDVDSANKVALLGPTVVVNLFGNSDPVGQTIRIKQVPFTVGGRPCTKGTVADRARPGRHHRNSHIHREEKSPGHSIGERGCRERHHDSGERRQPDPRRRGCGLGASAPASPSATRPRR